MKNIFVFLVVLTLLPGCASTAMNKYVGGSISEAFISYGKPENVFDLPDGRRAFQFYWGGSSATLPAVASSNVSGTPYNYNVTTTAMPARTVGSKGCLVTLIARKSGNDFIVDEYRIPKRVFC